MAPHSCQLNNINNTIITHRRSPHGYHPCLITCHHGYLPDTNSDGSTHNCQLNNINNTIITHRRSPPGYHPCLITCHHGYLPDTNSDGSTQLSIK